MIQQIQMILLKIYLMMEKISKWMTIVTKESLILKMVNFLMMILKMNLKKNNLQGDYDYYEDYIERRICKRIQ